MDSHRGVPLSDEIRAELRSIVAGIDRDQLAITGRLTPAQRFTQGVSISQAVLDAAIFRLRGDDPALTRDEAQRKALRRYYEANPTIYLPQE